MDEEFVTAKIIEFYVPQTFRRQVLSVPAEQRGKVIPFRTGQSGDGVKTYLGRWARLVSGETRMTVPPHPPASHL
jgi:hypothetical protein